MDRRIIHRVLNCLIPITYHFHLSGTVFCAAVSHTYSCKFSFYLSEGLVPKVLEVGHHRI